MEHDVERTYRIQERCFEFACAVIEFHESIPARSYTLRTLGNQLLRAGTSVGSNMAEADSAQSKADFVSKCSIATKEARESHYWLRLIERTKDGRRNPRVPPLLAEAGELVSILTAIVKRAMSRSTR